MATRVLMILLDAADADLIRRWASQGYLPTFARLEAMALRARVENPFGLYVGAIWPSFYTGVSPARHGRYSYTQLVPGTYRTRAMKRSDVQGTCFWSSLSRAGCRVAVIDVPKAPPAPEPVNGVMVVDWGLHETEVDGGLWTSPRSLARTIAERYGPDPVGPCDLIQGQPDEYARLKDRLLRRVDIKTRMVRDILQQDDWDLVLAGFAETHCAGHQLWHLHADAEALAADPARIAPADAMRDVYVAADRALGELLEVAGRDAFCLVLASHGFGPYRGGNKILDDILCRVDGAASSPGVERRTMEGLRGLWKRSAPLGVKRALITVRQRTWHHVQSLLLRREYARRRFFAVPNNDIYGAIRFNQVGREPRGRVRPEDVERVRDELEHELRSLVDLDTGGPAVARLVKASEYYDRHPRDGLPDLFVQWTGTQPIVRVRTARGDVVEGDYPNYRTGDHRDDGGVWVTGPGLDAQALARPISIMDFAPTIGALLNVGLPGLDGRPIPHVAAAAVPSKA
jgi:predicted AlkP superfamily phosphohydrolase/phosphomutase